MFTTRTAVGLYSSPAFRSSPTVVRMRDVRLIHRSQNQLRFHAVILNCLVLMGMTNYHTVLKQHHIGLW